MDFLKSVGGKIASGAVVLAVGAAGLAWYETAPETKHVILLSDGEPTTRFDPVEAGRRFQTANMTLSTIAIGNTKKMPSSPAATRMPQNIASDSVPAAIKIANTTATPSRMMLISDPPGSYNQRGERQHVTVESPLKIFQLRVQIFAQRHQRHIDRRDIEVQNREHRRDRDQSQPRVCRA